MANLTIVASIKAEPGRAEFIRSELVKLIETTRTEDGCVQYDLHEDNEHPEHFLFFENWASREQWQAHMENQHLKDFSAATEGAIAEFSLSEMTQIG